VGCVAARRAASDVISDLCFTPHTLRWMWRSRQVWSGLL